MSKLRSLLVALLALVFLAPLSQAQLCTGVYSPQVSARGVGDLLLFPIFYADSGVKTKIRVVNTSCKYGIVAKVVFRSPQCSEELRDFLIYLSPNDVWTAEIVVEGSDVVLRSTDDSSIVPTNHKAASETNPFVIHLRKPVNPNDTNKFGYIEVFAVAKVNWGWTDGSKTFRAIANENGFSNLHEFMYFLYKPSDPGSYSSIAYCPGSNGSLTSTNLRGLIAPIAYDEGYDPDCDGSPDPTNIFENCEPLYGTAELMLPGAYAAYRAVAVLGFVALGEDVTNQKLSRNYKVDYKVAAAIDTPLDLAGIVDCLDEALLKSEIYIPYYDPHDDDSCGSFALLFSPTMQSKYAYLETADKYTCMPSDFTSSIWNAVWPHIYTRDLGIHVTSYDNSEHYVGCEFSPCLLKFQELYFVGPLGDELFDPFAFSEGWMKLQLDGPVGNVTFVTPSGFTNGTVTGLPVIPLVGFYNADGITFVQPGWEEGSIE